MITSHMDRTVISVPLKHQKPVWPEWGEPEFHEEQLPLRELDIHIDMPSANPTVDTRIYGTGTNTRQMQWYPYNPTHYGRNS
jgi:hypothetical protein